MDLPAPRWRTLDAMLDSVLQILGPIPVGYEIHEGPGVPLHAHISARHFTYSNIGGTLNLLSSLAANAHRLGQAPGR